MSKGRRKKEKTSWRNASLIAAASLFAVAVFLARMSVGVSTLTAFSDTFTVSGGAISLPLLFAYLFSQEGADGFSYAAWQGFSGVLPFFKRTESYRDYKKRRAAQREGRRWDWTAAKVGGVLCLAGLAFAIMELVA